MVRGSCLYTATLSDNPSNTKIDHNENNNSLLIKTPNFKKGYTK